MGCTAFCITGPVRLRDSAFHFPLKAIGNRCVGRGKPLWTCRKGKPRELNGNRRGRGRSQKREALYDAMKSYFDYFAPLLEAELHAEQAEVLAQRNAASSRMGHTSEGYSLFNLTIAKESRLFSQEVYSLRFAEDNDNFATASKFRRGDLISIAPNNSFDNGVVEATVLTKTPSRLRVTVSQGSEGSQWLETYADNAETLSATLGTNTLAYERALAALTALTAPGPGTSEIARFLVMSFVEASQSDNEETVEKNGSPKDSRYYGNGLLSTHRDNSTFSKWSDFAMDSVSGVSLPDVNQVIREVAVDANGSQKSAIRAALRRRLTLIQGPPGTGKTVTTARAIASAIKLKLGPVLACAASNVAADNLMRMIIDSSSKGMRVVRVGRVAAIDETLWAYSLDCILEKVHTVKSARDAFMNENLQMTELKAIESKAALAILKKADVVVSTCMGCGRDELKELSFPFTVVDEATQATEPDVLIPLALQVEKPVRQVVLVGDQFQLPPTVLSEKRNGKGLATSLFLRLWRNGIECELLDTQYRMHPQISKFPSLHFYSKVLKDGVDSLNRPLPSLFNDAEYKLKLGYRSVLVDVVQGYESNDNTLFESGGQGYSYFNAEEAKVVLDVCKLLMGRRVTDMDRNAEAFVANDIGVISPYAGQVGFITRLMAKDKGPLTVEVSTVDGFQGREKNAIIVSAVRSNTTGAIGFLQDWRRLNVAITRARILLVVVGNADTLSSDPHWGAWVAWVKKHGVLLSPQQLT